MLTNSSFCGILTYPDTPLKQVRDLSEQQVVAPYFSFKIKERERKVRTPFRQNAGIVIVANSDGE